MEEWNDATKVSSCLIGQEKISKGIAIILSTRNNMFTEPNYYHTLLCLHAVLQHLSGCFFQILPRV